MPHSPENGMVTHEKGIEFSRWHGTINDMVAIADLARDTLKQWTGEEPSIRVDMTVGDQRSRGLSLDDLRRLHENRLNSVQRIRIDVAGTDSSEVEIRLRRRAPAITVTVTGDDEVQLEGLRATLRDRVRHYKKQWLWYFPRYGWLSVIGGVLIGSVVRQLVVRPLLHEPSSDITFVTVYAVVIAVASFAWWLFPNLELLPPGKEARWPHFRIWIVGTVLVGLILGVMSSGLWEWLRSLLAALLPSR